MNINDIPDPLVRAKVTSLSGPLDGSGPGCWFWTGATNANGYGHFVRRRGLPHRSQKKTYVHRYVYAELVGPIPRGHEVHHSCYNRWCCNPAHLSTMTHADNCAPPNR